MLVFGGSKSRSDRLFWKNRRWWAVIVVTVKDSTKRCLKKTSELEGISTGGEMTTASWWCIVIVNFMVIEAISRSTHPSSLATITECSSKICSKRDLLRLWFQVAWIMFGCSCSRLVLNFNVMWQVWFCNHMPIIDAINLWNLGYLSFSFGFFQHNKQR